MGKERSQYDVIEYLLANYNYKDKNDIMSLLDDMTKIAISRSDIPVDTINCLRQASILFSTLSDEDIDKIKQYLLADDDD